MWTDRVVELVEGLGRYALGELGDVTVLCIVLGRLTYILFGLRDPRPSCSLAVNKKSIPIIRIVQRPSRYRLHILHPLQLPLESSTQHGGEDGLADACVGTVNL